MIRKPSAARSRPGRISSRPASKPEVSGKIRLSDSGWETIGPQLWLQGKDWNTATSDEIKAAGEKLKAFAKHVKSFSGLDPNSVANGSIVLAQTNQGTARAAIGLNPKLKWVVPGPVQRALGRQLRDRQERAESRPGL